MSATDSCPKCGVPWPAGKPLPTTECPACGVIFAKFHAAQREKQRQLEEQAAIAAKAEMAEKKKAAKAATRTETPVLAGHPRLAACATCGGIVAYGAKACPHCGAAGPTPMGLMKCKECGSEVSTRAAACPKCGAPPPPPGRKTKGETWFVVIMLLIIFSVAIGLSGRSNRGSSDQRAGDDPGPSAARTAQYRAAGLRAGILRMSMKDPEAFALTSLLVMPDGVACYRYRAKNSFGAVLPSRAVWAPGTELLTEERDGNVFLGIWKAGCTAGGGEEIAPQVNRAIEQAKR